MLWAAFVLGILGSAHCVGMCGPIALALSAGRKPGWRMLRGQLGYNLGRATTYAAFGLVVGGLGQGLALAGAQAYLSVLAGFFLLLGGFTAARLERYVASSNPVKRALQKLKVALTKFLQKGDGSFYVIGLLNGLLPCALVYLALASALATGSALMGAAYMGIFGLGTLPVMLLSGALGQALSAVWRTRLRKLYPVVFVVLGLLLVYRGGSTLWHQYNAPAHGPQTVSCH